MTWWILLWFYLVVVFVFLGLLFICGLRLFPDVAFCVCCGDWFWGFGVVVAWLVLLWCCL